MTTMRRSLIAAATVAGMALTGGVRAEQMRRTGAPDAFVAVEVKLCAPSASIGVENVQTPLLFVVAVPSAVAPS